MSPLQVKYVLAARYGTDTPSLGGDGVMEVVRGDDGGEALF